jgi:hypothetical protein
MAEVSATAARTCNQVLAIDASDCASSWEQVSTHDSATAFCYNGEPEDKKLLNGPAKSFALPGVGSTGSIFDCIPHGKLSC